MKVVTNRTSLSQTATANDVPVGSFFTFEGDVYLYLRLDVGAARFRPNHNPEYINAGLLPHYHKPVIQPNDITVTLGGY